MIRFGCTERDAPGGHASPQQWMIQRSMDLAVEAADRVNETFIRPIKLEFEKVYFPYLLMNKKRYAALLWTNPGKFDKMDCKGIETVRRDNCGLVRRVIGRCLHTILVDRDPDDAVRYVKATVTELLMGRVDMSDLIITKALNKTVENSKSPQAHVVLAARMRKRRVAPRTPRRGPASV